MIWAIILVSTAFAQNKARVYQHMDACVDGDGEACLWVAKKLPKRKAPERLHRARAFAAEGCALSHEPSCQWLFASYEPQQRNDLPPPSVRDACRRESQSACDWLVERYLHSGLVDSFEVDPFELAMGIGGRYDALKVEPSTLLPRPSGPVTAVRSSGMSYLGASLSAGDPPLAIRDNMVHYQPRDGQQPMTVILPDRYTLSARHEWRRLGRQTWWNPRTGVLRELPEWCDWAATCVPSEPPWWVAEVEELRAEFPERLIRPMGEYVWLTPSRLSSREPPAATLVIGRDGQRRELALHGNLRLASDDLALVFREDHVWAHNGAGDLLWDRTMQAVHTALSPSGDVLASSTDLYDAHTDEWLYVCAHGCRSLEWSPQGELWCSTASGMTVFTVDGAGAPDTIPFVPPGGWEAYGRLTGKLDSANVLSLERGPIVQALEIPTDAQGGFQLFFPESDEHERLMVSIATGRDEQALVYNIGLPWLPPGETVHAEFPMSTVRIDFPDCVEQMTVHTSFNNLAAERGTLVSEDCSVSVGPLLVGRSFSVTARDRLGAWQARGVIEPNGVVTASHSPAPLLVQHQEPFQSNAVNTHVLLPSGFPRTTAVLFQSPDELWVETSYLELDPRRQDFVELAGRMSTRLLPGQWTVWSVSPDGHSASASMHTDGETVTVPVPDRPPGAMVRVVGEDRMPVDRYGASMRWNQAESNGSNERFLRPDLAGRIFVPDVGETVILEGTNWTTAVASGESLIQVYRPEAP